MPEPQDRPLEEIVARMLDGEEHSRREFVRRLAGTGLAVSGAGSFLAACGGVKGESSGAKKVKAVNHPKVPIGDWTFSNWPLYIDKSVLKTFDKKFGGHVKYVEEINDNYEFLAKVRQQLQNKQDIKRDIVTLTDYMAARWVRNGWTEPYDKKNVPNAKNLEDSYKGIAWDPKRDYTLPWQSGGTILGYNKKKTGRKITSIKSLFDPQFKGRVTFLSEAYDSAGLVMLMNGVNPTTAKIGEIDKAIDQIDKAQKSGQIRRFTGNDYTTDLTKGNAWISMAYSGDLVQLKADNPDIEFCFPSEGGMLFTDNMMLPAKTAHPYAAETMMNYAYDPQVAAKIAAYVNYISPVKGIKAILEKQDPKLASNPLIFPSPGDRAKLHPYPNLSPADERQMRDHMSQVTGG
jgi:spermidine/putrescine transport system substrate-binding protein